MAQPIEHSGVVERTTHDTVYVKITSQSACGSCRARQACGMAEAEEKIVTIPASDAASYVPGDSVTVGVKRRAGVLAVLLAYVGALVVLLAVLFSANLALGWSEGQSAAAALVAVVLYYGAMWLLRKKIEHTIQFTITKN